MDDGIERNFGGSAYGPPAAGRFPSGCAIFSIVLNRFAMVF